MKKNNNLHTKLDIIFVTLFIYCCFVLIFLFVFQLIVNDIIRALLSLFLPILFCRRNIVLAVNKFLHFIFRFRN